MKVLFLGQNPSRLNTTDNAFIGSPSYKRLAEWINYLKLVDYDLENVVMKPGKVSLNDVRDDIDVLCAKYDKVVALGHFASKALTARQILHFHMDHPSPLNRHMNDPVYVKFMLDLCAKWLKGDV
jgi:uracil-DNA glycosylase